MQQLGDVKQCWTLNSYAAQQIVALGYDRIRNIPARSQAEEEIHSAVYWCYYLDRTVSALLVRPTALPNLNVSPTELIASMQQSAYDPLIRILLDLAQIQGHLLAFSSDLKRADSRYILDTCNVIEERMHRISQDLRTVRFLVPSCPVCTTDDSGRAANRSQKCLNMTGLPPTSVTMQSTSKSSEHV